MSEIAQSCPTLCDPMDCRLPGSTIHGIFQARVLEWVAISFSRGSSQPRIEPRSPALEADALPSELPGKPVICISEVIDISSRQSWVQLVLHPEKWYRWTYFHNGRRREREQTCGHCEEEKGGTNWEMRTDLYKLPHVTQLVETCYQAQEFQLSGPW